MHIFLYKHFLFKNHQQGFQNIMKFQDLYSSLFSLVCVQSSRRLPAILKNLKHITHNTVSTKLSEFPKIPHTTHTPLKAISQHDPPVDVSQRDPLVP